MNMKIEQLIIFLFLLGYLNLNGQEWTRHEVETSSAEKLIQDCESQILFANGLSIFKYNGSSWEENQLETIDPNCEDLKLIRDPYSCDILAYSFFQNQCLSVWPFSNDPIVEIDILPAECLTMAYGPDFKLYGSCLEMLTIDSVGRIEKLNGENSPAFGISIGISKDNEIWVQGVNLNFDFELFLYKNGLWQNYPTISINRYFSHKDSEGKHWFRENDKLISYDGIDWITELTIPNTVSITDIAVDENENMWIASNLRGFYFWDKQTLTSYNSTNSGLTKDICSDLELVDNKTLWILHPDLITEFNFKGEGTAIVETNEIELKLYPNPTHGSFTLSFPHTEQRKIEIFSADGRLVYSKETESSHLEISSLEVLDAGCYWVKVSGALGIAVEKVVVY